MWPSSSGASNLEKHFSDLHGTITATNVNEMLPFKHAWSAASIRVFCSWASDETFERAFDELLFCQSMSFYAKCGIYRRALRLEAVRACQKVSLRMVSGPFEPADVMNWLLWNLASSEPRKLGLFANELAGGADGILDLLKNVSDGKGKAVLMGR